MLASVTGPEEAEIAIAGGADIIDLKDPSAGAFGVAAGRTHRETLAADRSPPPDERRDRRSGDAEPEPIVAAVREIAATGVDYVKVGAVPAAGEAAR